MDRKAERYLRKVNFKLAPATTRVVHHGPVAKTAVLTSVGRYSDEADSQILKSLPVFNKAVAYMADAYTESIMLTARFPILINVARRAIWHETWPGDPASKSKL